MGFYQHSKQSEHTKNVLKVLNEKYDGNILKWKDAEKEVKQVSEFLNKLKSISYITGNTNIDEQEQSNKITHIDFNSDNVDLIYSTKLPEPLLAYSLEYLPVKRVLPYSLSHLIDINKNKDYRSHKDSNEVSKVFNWVQERILSLNFSLQGINLNKKSGVFTYNTAMLDKNYGQVRQYITVKFDANKKLNIPNTDLTGTIKELSEKYNMLLMYFMMFGFNEIYCRCTCPDYIKKFSKRDGMANYFCPHILYSLAQMPWYLETSLS